VVKDESAESQTDNCRITWTFAQIIKETINAGLIKENSPENKSRKFKNYIPHWG